MVLDVRQATVGGAMVVKNGVSLGYPFIEAIISVLPWVDSFLVGECFSSDSTAYWLKRLQLKHPLGNKLRIIQLDWPSTQPFGQSIAVAQDLVIDRVDTDWVLLVQADEIWPPETSRVIPLIISQEPLVDPSTPRGLLSKFLHVLDNFQVEHPKPSYRSAMRLAQRSQHLKSFFDGFTLEFSVPAEIDLIVGVPPIVHCGYEFPLSSRKKRINQAGLYPGHIEYQNGARDSQIQLDALEFVNDPLYDLTTSPFDLPEILKGLVGKKEYYVREDFLWNFLPE